MYFSNRCACFTSLNQLDNALKDAQDCVRIKPDWAKGHYRLGHTLALLHRYEEAQAALQKGSKVDPSNQDIGNRLKEVNVLIKQDAAKRAKYGKDVTAAIAAKHEGNELYKDGKFPEAVIVYTRGLQCATKDEEKIALLNNRAACHFQDRNFRQAVNDASEVLMIDEKNVKALLRRATSFENIEKLKQAVADYELLRELSPGLQQVTNGLHRCQRALKQMEGHAW